MTSPPDSQGHTDACVAWHPDCGCRRRRGGRARRGWVRAALLALLAERPMHGYEMISELATRTGGLWRPSPGSVYPTLQTLQDEGLVTTESHGGKSVHTLTDTGRQVAAPVGAAAPWDELGANTTPQDTSDDLLLRQATAQLISALDQVLLAGTPEQKTKSVRVLTEARRAIYRILADGD